MSAPKRMVICAHCNTPDAHIEVREGKAYVVIIGRHHAEKHVSEFALCDLVEAAAQLQAESCTTPFKGSAGKIEGNC